MLKVNNLLVEVTENGLLSSNFTHRLIMREFNGLWGWGGGWGSSYPPGAMEGSGIIPASEQQY